ncbi:MAG TPA: hypothetical protein VHF86_10995 [Xanthomonadaceae bacterium]|nr:hypothetical protein [Xanthomonadaceae bacterium]
MVEIIEESWGFVVRTEHSRETFQCKSNAVLAARILAMAEAVMSQRDVDVLVPMGNGETVCLEIAACA